MLRFDTAEVDASGRAQAVVDVLSAAVERCRITHLCDEASVWARWGCVRLSPTTGVVRYDGSGLRMTRRVGDVLAEPSDRLLFAVPAAGGTLWQDGLIRGLHGDDLVLVDPSTPYDYRGGEGTCSAVRVDLSALAVSVVQARAAAPRLRASPLHALVRGHVLALAATVLTAGTAEAAGELDTATTGLLTALVLSCTN